MKVNLDIIKKKQDYTFINKIPLFYYQVLTAWQQVSYFMPKTPNEIVNEYVMYNKNIRIGNKVIESKFIKLPNLKILAIF